MHLIALSSRRNGTPFINVIYDEQSIPGWCTRLTIERDDHRRFGCFIRSYLYICLTPPPQIDAAVRQGGITCGVKDCSILCFVSIGANASWRREYQYYSMEPGQAHHHHLTTVFIPKTVIMLLGTPIIETQQWDCKQRHAHRLPISTDCCTTILRLFHSKAGSSRVQNPTNLRSHSSLSTLRL